MEILSSDPEMQRYQHGGIKPTKYAGLEDLRLPHLHIFSHSDLVLPFYFPPMIPLPTSHYSEERFFSYANALHSIVGSDIYVQHSQQLEESTSLYASNLYAAYEVSHWPGVETQMVWTAWVVELMKSLNTGNPIPMLPDMARGLFRRALRDEMEGARSWFLERVPRLRQHGTRRALLSRTARNPMGSSVIEIEDDCGLRVERIDGKARQQRDNGSEETVARYSDFIIDDSCLETPKGHVKTLLACVRDPRKLPDVLTKRGDAAVPFDKNGLYAPEDSRRPETPQQQDESESEGEDDHSKSDGDGGDEAMDHDHAPSSSPSDDNDVGGYRIKSCTQNSTERDKSRPGEYPVASSLSQQGIEHNQRLATTSSRAVFTSPLRTPTLLKLPTTPQTSYTGDTIPDPNFSSPPPNDHTHHPLTAQEAIMLMQQSRQPTRYDQRCHAQDSIPTNRGFGWSPNKTPHIHVPPRTFGDVEVGRSNVVESARGRGRGRGRGPGHKFGQVGPHALQVRDSNAKMHRIGAVQDKQIVSNQSASTQMSDSERPRRRHGAEPASVKAQHGRTSQSLAIQQDKSSMVQKAATEVLRRARPRLDPRIDWATLDPTLWPRPQ